MWRCLGCANAWITCLSRKQIQSSYPGQETRSGPCLRGILSQRPRMMICLYAVSKQERLLRTKHQEHFINKSISPEHFPRHLHTPTSFGFFPRGETFSFICLLPISLLKCYLSGSKDLFTLLCIISACNRISLSHSRLSKSVCWFDSQDSPHCFCNPLLVISFLEIFYVLKHWNPYYQLKRVKKMSFAHDKISRLIRIIVNDGLFFLKWLAVQTSNNVILLYGTIERWDYSFSFFFTTVFIN
jgi:hypothetical protein